MEWDCEQEASQSRLLHSPALTKQGMPRSEKKSHSAMKRVLFV